GGGWIRVFDPAHPGSASNPDTSAPFASGTVGSLVDLKVDSAGSLYYLSAAGVVAKISYGSSPSPTPTPTPTSTPTSTPTPTGTRRGNPSSGTKTGGSTTGTGTQPGSSPTNPSAPRRLPAVPVTALSPGLTAEFFDFTKALRRMPRLGRRAADVTRTDADL